MPGFSREEQQVLAALVGSHRRRLHVDDFHALPAAREPEALRLCALLRLAVCLTRSRSPRPLPKIRLRASSRRLRIAFPRGWLARQPLTRADLLNESAALHSAGLALAVPG
jgi:exopolyphosphatase/guanosine-5'-triphosphate,3'-diphosphate pyrophosphatase